MQFTKPIVPVQKATFCVAQMHLKYSQMVQKTAQGAKSAKSQELALCRLFTVNMELHRLVISWPWAVMVGAEIWSQLSS